ncbi:MAG: CDP-2,3-bis-(O-geranylgeranyl)-sn-glycerol synthase [Candidatus Bathyarchaeota archaeon]|jgi:CDP-2,3-bis-(O-geranylgeranyl)-sn-glycerol synthase
MVKTIIAWLMETIYVYLPAYIANATPVILGGGGPLDGGRNWIDGKPLLGDHKTVRGTCSGLAAGFLIGLAQQTPLRGALLSIGAIGGDLIVSFIKRRMNLEPGSLFPVADQMGFIIFAVTLVSLTDKAPTWDHAIGILVATLPIHYLTNVLAWALKLKSNPW